MVHEITTWLSSRFSDHDVKPLRPEENHLIWRIDRSASDAAPVFLKIPGTYVYSEGHSRSELTRALDREGLERRVAEASRGSESAWLLTRETTGRVKDFTLQETDPPSGADRSLV